MNITNPLADAYVDNWSNATPSYLRGMFDETLQKHPHAHLQSSWVQGGLLSFLSKLIRPQYILEIGTFSGFSTLCLAEGISENGKLHTIELRSADAAFAMQQFAKSPKSNQIEQHIGDAKTIIPSLTLTFDLAFIDADKIGYIEYYDLILPKIKPGGIIIADNTLFKGEVFLERSDNKSARAIKAFNEHVYHDTKTEKVILTVRDGLTLIRKN